MSEYTIPLTLPLRRVVITSLTASPPDSVAQEMARFAGRPQRPAGYDSPETRSQSVSATELTIDSDHEVKQIREQRSAMLSAIQNLHQVTKQTERQIDLMVREMQEATVELACAIASKLIFEEVDSDRFPIANLVHEVISRLDTTAAAVVRLHPDDLALIQQQPMISGTGEDRSLEFVADPTLNRGDCKAKSGEISVVYQLRRQIDDLRRQLLSTVNGHAET